MIGRDCKMAGMGKACPRCSRPMWKVIFVGLPGRLCQNFGCSVLTGPAEFVPNWLAQLTAGPQGFGFMPYEGSYWRALWRWLRD